LPSKGAFYKGIKVDNDKKTHQNQADNLKKEIAVEWCEENDIEFLDD
jgi:hypothetical protein